MNGKKMKKLLGSCLLLLGLMLISTFSVSAATVKNPTKVNLKIGSARSNVYKSYDITGDRKVDQFNIAVGIDGKIDQKDSNGYYNNIFVSINNKSYIMKSATYFYGAKASLYTLGNGKPYLYIDAITDNDYHAVCGLFNYDSTKKKMVTAANFATLFNGYAARSSGDIVKISGNTIKVRYGLMSYSLGGCTITYNYTYKNGKLLRTSYYGTLVNIAKGQHMTKLLTAKRTLTAYKTPGTTQKAFTIKKGAPVKIMQVWRKGNSMYIKLMYGGSYGWIKAATANTSQQFSDVVYAG